MSGSCALADGIPVEPAFAAAVQALHRDDFEHAWFTYRLFGDPAFSYAASQLPPAGGPP